MNLSITNINKLMTPYNIFYKKNKILETKKKLCVFLYEKHKKKYKIVRNAQKLCKKYLKLLYFI